MPTFLLDENVNHPYQIIDICAELEVKVLWIYEVEMEGADDSDIFALAMERDYVIVTGNITHFRPLQHDWMAIHDDSPGIVYIPSRWQKNA